MDNGTLSASDVALLSGNNGFDGWGGNSMMWIFALLILAGGGFGGLGWGNNAALGYENLATSNEVQRGFDNQNLQAQTRDILAAVNAGTAQAVAATIQSLLFICFFPSSHISSTIMLKRGQPVYYFLEFFQRYCFAFFFTL